MIALGGPCFVAFAATGLSGPGHGIWNADTGHPHSAYMLVRRNHLERTGVGRASARLSEPSRKESYRCLSPTYESKFVIC